MFKVMLPYLVDGLVGQFFAVRHNSRRMRNSSLDRCFSCWHTVKYKTVPPFLIGAEHMFCVNYSTWFHKREELNAILNSRMQELIPYVLNLVLHIYLRY